MKKKLKINLQITILVLILISSACGNNSNINSAKTQLSSISGRVYFDENSDQICDCDCGIEDIKIRLYPEKCVGTFQETASSDAEGYYEFTDLKPGKYCVFPDISFSCEGYFPTSGINRIIILEENQDILVEWFSYELYYELGN